MEKGAVYWFTYRWTGVEARRGGDENVGHGTKERHN